VPALESLQAAGHEMFSCDSARRPKAAAARSSHHRSRRAPSGSPSGDPTRHTARRRYAAVAAGCRRRFFIVVAFGHLLRESVLKIPRQGCINVHASLLPRYGPGPDPLAVINGEMETGVTTMMMDKGSTPATFFWQLERPLPPRYRGLSTIAWRGWDRACSAKP